MPAYVGFPLYEDKTKIKNKEYNYFILIFLIKIKDKKFNFTNIHEDMAHH